MPSATDIPVTRFVFRNVIRNNNYFHICIEISHTPSINLSKAYLLPVQVGPKSKHQICVISNNFIESLLLTALVKTSTNVLRTWKGVRNSCNSWLLQLLRAVAAC